MDEELIIVDIEDVVSDEVAIDDIEQYIEKEETVEYIEVEEAEEIEVEFEEGTGWVGGDSTKHYSLYGRDEADQHPIKAITGLRKELDEIERLKTVYSDSENQANYYMWKDENPNSENRDGYFVSIHQNDNRIRICKSDEDEFGVTVSDAGFIGNQNEKNPRGSNYGLVVHSGLVSVRCELDPTDSNQPCAKAGDYVVSNDYGIAKKTDGTYGYRVSASSKIDGVWHVIISLTIPTTQVQKLSKVTQDVSKRMGSAETNIAAAISLANAAHNKAQVAHDWVQGNVENIAGDITIIGGKVDEAITDIDGLKDSVAGSIVQSDKAYEIASKAEQYASDTRTHVDSELNEAHTSINNLTDAVAPITTWASFDENGHEVEGASYLVEHIKHIDENFLETKTQIDTVQTLTEENQTAISQNAENIQLLATSIDKYSVGEWSQAYGLTLSQAWSILNPGMIYIPTPVTHYEKYVYEIVDIWDEQGKDTSMIYKEKNTGLYWRSIIQKDENDNLTNQWESIDLTITDNVVFIIDDTQAFTRGYYYTWNGFYWVESEHPYVYFSAAYVLPSKECQYWYRDTNEDLVYDGITYKAHGLYMIINDKWTEVNILDGNVTNRVASMINQTANSISLDVSNAKGDIADLKLEIGAQGSKVAMVAANSEPSDIELTGSVESFDKLPTTDVQNGVYYAVEQKVYRYNDNEWKEQYHLMYDGVYVKKINAANIIAAVNNDESTATINADKINIDGLVSFTNGTNLKDWAQSAISKVEVQYILGESPTTPPSPDDKNWSSVAPQWEDGKYIWQRTVTTYEGTGKDSSISGPTCIQGAKGKDGDGVAIKGTAYAKVTIDDSKIGNKYALYSDKDYSKQIASANNGDTYIVDGYLFVYSGSNNEFTCVGKIRGEAGASLQVKYKNSATTPTITDVNDDTWFDNIQPLSDGQKTYMIQKMSNETTWSTPVQISAVDGEPGKDGTMIEYVYCLSATATKLDKPSYDENGNLLGGWKASPQGVTAIDKYEYMSLRTTDADGKWGEFSDPVIWSKWGDKGQDGDGVEYKYCRSNSSAFPSYPNPSTGLTWTDDPQGVNGTNKYEYVVQITTTRSSDIGFEGIDVKKINTHSRNFTLANWKKYGTFGHEENWTTGTSYDNSHINIGDTAYITGTISGVTKVDGSSVEAAIYGTVTDKATNHITMITTALIIDGQSGASTTVVSNVALWAKWGEKGDPGRSTTGVTNYYYATQTDTETLPDIGATDWKTKVSELTNTFGETYKYLWNYEVVSYSVGDSDITDPTIIGVYSKGAAGKGIKEIAEYYITTPTSTAPTVLPTIENSNGWTKGGTNVALPQTSKDNPYLWNYEIIDYTEGNDFTSGPVCIGTYGNSIKSITEYYAATATNQVPNRYSSGTTTINAKTWKASITQTGHGATKPYVWNFERTEYTIDNPKDTDVTLLTYTPRVIDTITEYYMVKPDDTTPESPSYQTDDSKHNSEPTVSTDWSITKPSVSQGDSLWNCEVIKYTAVDGNGKNLYEIVPAARIGYAGKDGNPGVGISEVIEYYAISNDKDSAPTSWNTTLTPPTKDQPYLWNYEETKYTVGDPKTTTPVIIAMYTEDGRGITDVENYYLASNLSTGITKDNMGTYTWSSTPISTTVDAPYLWNYEKIIYNYGDPTITDPCIVGVQGESGIGIKEVKPQYYLASVAIKGIAYVKEDILYSDEKCETQITNASSGDAYFVDGDLFVYSGSNDEFTRQETQWQYDEPTWQKNHYIWTRSEITWEDGAITYTEPILAGALNSANENADQAKVYAENALIKATGVETTIGEWCYRNDVTYINGGKIYAGSVTANKLFANTLKSEDYLSPTADYPFSQQGTFFNLKDGSITSKNFAIDDKGNATIAGKITATSGYIGDGVNGFTVASEGTLTYTVTDEMVDAVANDKYAFYFKYKNKYYIIRYSSKKFSSHPEVVNGDMFVVDINNLTAIIKSSDGTIKFNGLDPVTTLDALNNMVINNGFDITSGISGNARYYLCNGQNSLKGDESTKGTPGVYIAPDGIGIGNGNFYVDNLGNLTTNGGITLNNTYITDSNTSKNSVISLKNGSMTLTSKHLDEDGNEISSSGMSLVDGNLTLSGNIILGGSITWNASSNPVKVLYATTGGTPTHNDWIAATDDDDSTTTIWHTIWDEENDKYAAYSYNGGKTWDSAIKIKGDDGDPVGISEEDVFDMLTNGGGTQGIFPFYTAGNADKVSTADIYINASYIQSGTLNGITVKSTDESDHTIEMKGGHIQLWPSGYEEEDEPISLVDLAMHEVTYMNQKVMEPRMRFGRGSDGIKGTGWIYKTTNSFGMMYNKEKGGQLYIEFSDANSAINIYGDVNFSGGTVTGISGGSGGTATAVFG